MQANAVAVRIGVLDSKAVGSGNGRGFDPQGLKPGGMGLSTMRERAEALGGRLQVISEPGQGTKVSLELEVA
jgi:signal transduction histidine kinase